MSKQVFSSEVLKQVQCVRDFTMVLKGRAITKQGVNLTKFLEAQNYVIDPVNGDGSVVELSIDQINEGVPVDVVLPAESVPTRKKMGRPAGSKNKVASKPASGKRTMSAAAKARIAASQKKRWAKIRKEKEEHSAKIKAGLKRAKKAGKKEAPKKSSPKPKTAKVKPNGNGKVAAADLPPANAQVADRPAA